jgi:CubicO group peptidase (beta-lactamase class C family)
VQTSFSVAKSFDATMVGLAVEEGLLSLSDPVTEWVPELLGSDERFADITIEHLISMTSGLAYSENVLPWGDAARTYYAPDLREVALSAEVEGPPGEEFLYNNYNPLILGMVLERATGMPVTEFLESRVWHPMGAEYAGSWSLDSDESAFEKMESGINGRAVDFLKLGMVHANAGSIDGRQVLPETWVAEATTRRSEPYDGYGYHWWTPDRSGFSAVGNHGQFIWVDPDAGVVVVRMGRSYGGMDLDDWFDVFEQVVVAVD